MKRKFLIVAALVCTALSANAQFSTDIDHSMEFVDAEGNIVADGSVIDRNEVEETDFGDLQISSGLYAKNTTDEIVGVGVQLTFASFPSGSFQHCFPGSCVVSQPSSANTSYIQGPLASKAGTTESLQSEWLVEEGEYGTCTVTYQFKIYEADPITWEWNFSADGPSVTVNYIYTDPAGVDANIAEKALGSVSYHDLSGRTVSNPAGGVYVKRMTYADGTVKTSKVLLK